MANPTSNFGWQMPTPTDLVTDLPADFEVFGQAVDTSLADLKGGTTGQVLSKNSNTDMDFVWVTDAAGDITGVTAGTGITGGGTSGAVTVSFDQANFGGGQFAAGKNKIINGDFGVWQRGISFSNPANGDYTTDRFKISFDGTGATRTVSQQTFTPGTAPVAGYEGQYFYRVAQTVAGSGQTFLTPVIQRIENVQTLAGQTATLSFWAKAGANISITGGLVQNFGSGGSGSVNTSVGTHNLTTSWQRFTATVSIPSLTGKTIGTSAFLELYFDSGSPTAAQTLDFWGFQLESGSTATPFQTASGSIQGEFALCQRYCINYNFSLFGKNAYNTVSMGMAMGATQGRMNFNLPVSMRVSPTSVTFTAGAFVLDNGTSAPTVTSITVNQGGTNVTLLDVNASAGTLIFKDPLIMYANNNANANLILSAEL